MLKLLELGCSLAIITLGSDGSVFASNEDNRPDWVGTNKVNAIDTTVSIGKYIQIIKHLA